MSGFLNAMEFAKHVSIIGFDINEDRLDKLREQYRSVW